MRAEHLSDSEIAGFLDRDLSADERSSVESHLESCPNCRAATLDVSRMAGAYEASPADSKGHVLPRARSWRLGLPAGVAFAAVASLAIVWLGKARNPTQTAPVRSATTITADARPTLEVIGPSEEVPANPRALSFVWRSAGTNLYRFAILDETGKPVVERDVSDTVFVLPLTIRLEPDRLYFWRVDAVADGIAASSGARKLRLAR